MGKNSGIPWTDHTHNPWWGCDKVSAGCAHCYAETFANRFGQWWGSNPRRLFGDKHWDEPLRWNRAAAKAGVRQSVFCGSMCDVLEPADISGERYRLANMIANTSWLNWLLLTKRPENAHLFEPWFWELPNIRFGVTAENQEMFDQRIPWLLDRKVRNFVSIEPLLGPIDLEGGDLHGVIEELDWVIVGDESGRKRRPAKLDWVRAIRDQCADAGVPFFFKQWHGASDGKVVDKAQFDPEGTITAAIHNAKLETPELDGVRHVAFPDRVAG